MEGKTARDIYKKSIASDNENDTLLVLTPEGKYYKVKEVIIKDLVDSNIIVLELFQD